MAEHLTADEIERFRCRTLSVADTLRVDDHLTLCESCRAHLQDDALMARAVSGIRATLDPAEAVELFHLPFELLAGYVDRSLDAGDRARVQVHLDGCAECAARERSLRVFSAEMSNYPAHRHGPSMGEQAAVRRPHESSFTGRSALAWRLSMAAAGAATVAALGVYALSVLPLQRELDAQRARVIALQAEREQRAPVAPAPQVPDVPPDLTARLTRLERDRERMLRENEGLRRDQEVLRRRLARAPSQTQPSPSAAPSPRGKDGAPRMDELATPVQLAKLFPVETVLRSDPRSANAGPARPAAFRAVAPVGTFVIEDRPTFTWTPIESATDYEVSVYDTTTAYSPLKLDGKVAKPPWRPPSALPRDRILQWEVIAYRNGAKVGTASSPASFMLLKEREARELEQAGKRHTGSHLTLAALYAEAGVLDRAEGELEALLRAHPGSLVARRLLEAVRRRHAGGR